MAETGDFTAEGMLETNPLDGWEEQAAAVQDVLMERETPVHQDDIISSLDYDSETVNQTLDKMEQTGEVYTADENGELYRTTADTFNPFKS